MMDWTDRHCRYFFRGFSPDTLLYTEMITTGAVLRGDVQRLLAYDSEEHPVALQLGGSDLADLAAAARIGADLGYDEINLNCGCPSDRVHSGAFGACLMLRPRVVADCVAAMRAAVDIPVTVKLRIGVVDAAEAEAHPTLTRREFARAAAARFGEPERAALHEFVDGIVAAGCAAVIVHARKAVLGAWSPRDNREIPPLRYDVVRDVQQRVAPVPVVLNGGLRTTAQVASELEWADGIMLGREAYHRPMLLAELSPHRTAPTRLEMLERMTVYARRELARGERLSWIARHMLGLYAGQPGAKEFRRRLSEGARDADAAPELLLEAGRACERLTDAAA